MKSESPAPKPGAITRTQILAASPPARQRRWPNGQLKYAPTGLEVFPVDPDTKAPIGATEGPNGETIWMATKGHRPPPATPQPSPHGGLRPDALIGGRIPKDVVVLDIDPRHDGHDTWDTIVAGHDLPTTRCTLRPQRRRLSHLVSAPRPDRIDAGDGIDVLHHGAPLQHSCRRHPIRQPAAPTFGSNARRFRRCGPCPNG